MITSEDIRNGNFTINDMKKWFAEHNISFADLMFRVNAKCNEVENKELKDRIEQSEKIYGIKI